jgi:hypothetical protein
MEESFRERVLNDHSFNRHWACRTSIVNFVHARFHDPVADYKTPRIEMLGREIEPLNAKLLSWLRFLERVRAPGVMLMGLNVPVFFAQLWDHALQGKAICANYSWAVAEPNGALAALEYLLEYLEDPPRADGSAEAQRWNAHSFLLLGDIIARTDPGAIRGEGGLQLPSSLCTWAHLKAASMIYLRQGVRAPDITHVVDEKYVYPPRRMTALASMFGTGEKVVLAHNPCDDCVRGATVECYDMPEGHIATPIPRNERSPSDVAELVDCLYAIDPELAHPDERRILRAYSRVGFMARLIFALRRAPRAVPLAHDASLVEIREACKEAYDERSNAQYTTSADGLRLRPQPLVREKRLRAETRAEVELAGVRRRVALMNVESTTDVKKVHADHTRAVDRANTQFALHAAQPHYADKICSSVLVASHNSPIARAAYMGDWSPLVCILKAHGIAWNAPSSLVSVLLTAISSAFESSPRPLTKLPATATTSGFAIFQGGLVVSKALPRYLMGTEGLRELLAAILHGQMFVYKKSPTARRTSEWSRALVTAADGIVASLAATCAPLEALHRLDIFAATGGIGATAKGALDAVIATGIGALDAAIDADMGSLDGVVEILSSRVVQSPFVIAARRTIDVVMRWRHDLAATWYVNDRSPAKGTAATPAAFFPISWVQFQRGGYDDGTTVLGGDGKAPARNYDHSPDADVYDFVKGVANAVTARELLRSYFAAFGGLPPNFPDLLAELTALGCRTAAQHEHIKRRKQSMDRALLNKRRLALLTSDKFTKVACGTISDLTRQVVPERPEPPCIETVMTLFDEAICLALPRADEPTKMSVYGIEDLADAIQAVVAAAAWAPLALRVREAILHGVPIVDMKAVELGRPPDHAMTACGRTSLIRGVACCCLAARTASVEVAKTVISACAHALKFQPSRMHPPIVSKEIPHLVGVVEDAVMSNSTGPTCHPHVLYCLASETTRMDADARASDPTATNVLLGDTMRAPLPAEVNRTESALTFHATVEYIARAKGGDVHAVKFVGASGELAAVVHLTYILSSLVRPLLPLHGALTDRTGRNPATGGVGSGNMANTSRNPFASSTIASSAMSEIDGAVVLSGCRPLVDSVPCAAFLARYPQRYQGTGNLAGADVVPGTRQWMGNQVQGLGGPPPPIDIFRGGLLSTKKQRNADNLDARRKRKRQAVAEPETEDPADKTSNTEDDNDGSGDSGVPAAKRGRKK